MCLVSCLSKAAACVVQQRMQALCRSITEQQRQPQQERQSQYEQGLYHCMAGCMLCASIGRTATSTTVIATQLALLYHHQMTPSKRRWR